MWAPAGPSWLMEHQPPLPPSACNAPSQSSFDYSPPTKWPRATTPVNMRSSDTLLLGTSADSGVGLSLSFNSPPIVNRVDQCRMSPGLRTPTSRPGIHMSATPSPFRSFRLSFGSPTFSDRALRLSNSENVVGFRYRGGSIEKPQHMAEMMPLHSNSAASGSVNRCLQMPSTSDDILDRTLPMTMGDVFDPQDISSNMADDSGLFGVDVSLQATSTPLPHSPQPFLSSEPSIPSVHNPYVDLGNQTTKALSPEVVLKKSSPPTPSSFKRAMRDVQRKGILQPRKLLVDNSIIPSPAAELLHPQHSLKSQVDCSSETVKRKRESSLTDSFEVPKKPLKPYSRRWMRLVTGGTRSQRDLTAAAHAFIARLPRIGDSW